MGPKKGKGKGPATKGKTGKTGFRRDRAGDYGGDAGTIPGEQNIVPMPDPTVVRGGKGVPGSKAGGDKVEMNQNYILYRQVAELARDNAENPQLDSKIDVSWS